MAVALKPQFARLGGLAGCGALGLLLARPWLQPALHQALALRDIVWLAALIPGTAIGYLLWIDAPMRQAAAVTALAGAVVVSATMAAPAGAIGGMVVLVALPCGGALRRCTWQMSEARVGGAGLARILAGPVLRAALPGLIYGSVIGLLSERIGVWQTLAASLPLFVRWRPQALSAKAIIRPAHAPAAHEPAASD